jgi:hypothetical protein
MNRAFRPRSLAPETCLEIAIFANLVEDQVRQPRPKEEWCLVPELQHGSGTGDHWHGGKGGPMAL